MCAPCFAAIGAIHREMGDSKWTWLAISYQCGLAYCASLIVYQFGHIFFEGGQLTVGTLAALIVLGLLLFALIKRPQQKKFTTITSSRRSSRRRKNVARFF